MNSCTIIGLSDSPRQFFPKEALEEIRRSTVFSGGVRHRGLVEQLLPEGAHWIDIVPPLAQVFSQYEREDHVVIFASGDPLFYGFAATVKRHLPQCRMRVFPTFNSLQTLAHCLCLPYSTMRAVSLTGRDWDALDEALILREPLIGCLTDPVKTPDAIWQRMLAYGYDNYALYVGERLGNAAERVCRHAAGATYANPNCLIASMTEPRPRLFGLPDKEFALLDGRAAMITKMPIRLATLAALQLGSSTTLWDIGFCTGSVSIEARLSFPRVRVVAFEQRPQCKALLEENAHHFGTPGITTVMGDFLKADLSRLPRPDAVFIGGHGGRLPQVMNRISTVLQPGGRIVFNSVSDESRRTFLTSAAALGKQCRELHRIKVDDHNTITILTAT